jgi:integrase
VSIRFQLAWPITIPIEVSSNMPSSGEPYTPDTLTRMWHKLAKSAGVRPIRLHDARHSCGTALHLRGVPLAVIAAWLGHADASTTARLYVHSQSEALVAAGQSLGAVVSPSCH